MIGHCYFSNLLFSPVHLFGCSGLRIQKTFKRSLELKFTCVHAYHFPSSSCVSGSGPTIQNKDPKVVKFNLILFFNKSFPVDCSRNWKFVRWFPFFAFSTYQYNLTKGYSIINGFYIKQFFNPQASSLQSSSTSFNPQA